MLNRLLLIVGIPLFRRLGIFLFSTIDYNESSDFANCKKCESRRKNKKIMIHIGIQTYSVFNFQLWA